MAQLRAPARNGEVLAIPGFDAIPALVAENRRKLDRDDVRIGGLPLKELRALARREVLNAVGQQFKSEDRPFSSSVTSQNSRTPACG